MKEVQQPESPITLDAIGKTPIVQLRKIVPRGVARQQGSDFLGL